MTKTDGTIGRLRHLRVLMSVQQNHTTDDNGGRGRVVKKEGRIMLGSYNQWSRLAYWYFLYYRNCHGKTVPIKSRKETSRRKQVQTT